MIDAQVNIFAPKWKKKITTSREQLIEEFGILIHFLSNINGCALFLRFYIIFLRSYLVINYINICAYRSFYIIGSLSGKKNFRS